MVGVAWVQLWKYLWDNRREMDIGIQVSDSCLLKFCLERPFGTPPFHHPPVKSSLTYLHRPIGTHPPCTLTHSPVKSFLAWENSRHFAKLPLVSSGNDIWVPSAEIPYRWRVTTQIWVALLIGWSNYSTIQKPTQIWVLTCHQCRISAFCF